MKSSKTSRRRAREAKYMKAMTEAFRERRRKDLKSRRGQTKRERHGGDRALVTGFLSSQTSRNRDIEILSFDPALDNQFKLDFAKIDLGCL